MRAVVTGGAGFIGSHVTRRLIDAGWSVAVLDDLSGGDRDNVPSAVELIVADVASEDAARQIERVNPDVIVHAAAQVSVPRSMADPDEDWRVNVVGTKRVIDAANVTGARVVFLSSGGAIYGDTNGADEDALPAPRSYYAVHKYVAERYLELSGADHAIARLANAYGPGQRADQEGGVVAIFVDALRNAAPITIFGTGEQRRDFVHVSDIAAAIVDLASSQRVGVWNVGTGVAVSINELLRALEGAFGRVATVTRQPSRVGDVFSSRLIVDRIEHDFGWRPATSLASGIRALALDVTPSNT